MGTRVALVPAILALLAHAWSLRQPFLAEDFALLVQGNARMAAANGAPLAWILPPEGMASSSFFRPAIDASMGLDYWFFGTEPAGYHATNLVLFALTTALVALLAWRLVGDVFVGIVAGVLLALSPIVPENVVWIAGRDGLIPAVLVLAAAHAMLTERRPRLLLLASGLYLLALFAKEWVVAAAPVLVAVRVLARRARRTEAWWPALRETALLWPAILIYLSVRAAVIGGVVGGYGGISLDADRGLLEGRLDYLLGLILQVPESALSGWARYASAAVVLALLAWGWRAAARVLGPVVPAIVASCVLWIVLMMGVHFQVQFDPVTFADSRYLWPALPPTCILFALACAGWPRGRTWLAIGLGTASTLGLVDGAREFAAAGRASDALRSAAVDVAREEGVSRVEVSGLPPNLGRAHFGITLLAAFAPPFREREATPIVTHQDLYIPHLGKRRTAGFRFMIDAVRSPIDGVRFAYFDRRRREIRVLPDPDARLEVRGRLELAARGARLACTNLTLRFQDRVPVPAAGSDVALQGRVDRTTGTPQFLVESVATNAEPILSIRRPPKAAGRVGLSISGAAGSFYAVYASAAAATLVLPGFGILAVDAPQPVIVGYLDDTGRSTTDYAVGARALPRIQVALFTPSGSVHVSRCFCED